MPTEEQMQKIADGVRKQSERYGLPTMPRKKKSRDKRVLAVLEKTIPVIKPK